LNGEKSNHSREIDRICRDLGIEKTHQWLWAMVVRAYYFIAQVLSLPIILTIKAGKVQNILKQC
jgi:hypothetical protein